SSAAVPSDAFSGKAASGAPVRIGLIANEGGQAMSLPETREAAEAATKYANENLGGIAGRPIELVICKEQEDPVSARNCANQMVEQK
ncbi:ABC transporter substrate-binding protein, partial [Streptomyces sp. SID10244]|nr:ABC transporter substrate-binding protein [Streptomyces sp. SID10244]